MGASLQPFRNVSGAEPLWQAEGPEPAFRLGLEIPADGGWLSLVWECSLTDPVERPILIFERSGEDGALFETDALLAGSAFGRQKAVIFVPAGTRNVLFSPVPAAAKFGFRLHVARWISPLQAFGLVGVLPPELGPSGRS